MFGWPDAERSAVLRFRIYNQHMAEVPGTIERPHLRRRVDQLVGPGGHAPNGQRLAKALGLKTFLLPLQPGKDADKRPIDYASTASDDVWAAIEELQVPVSHHIGENPPSTPNEFNALGIGMLQSVAPFRDTFGKYIFGGILDRHPGLRIGWFEGGINWVPSVIQDAQHISVSFQHLANLEVQHDPKHYWDNHMSASFMVDPLWGSSSSTASASTG